MTPLERAAKILAGDDGRQVLLMEQIIDELLAVARASSGFFFNIGGDCYCQQYDWECEYCDRRKDEAMDSIGALDAAITKALGDEA